MWLVLFFGMWANGYQDRLDRLEAQQAQIQQAEHAAEHRRMLYELWGIRIGPSVTPVAIRPGPRDSPTEMGDWDR